MTWLVILPGILFGVGLALSGMTDPSKVVGFLDVFGDWDPSLMFVMGGAIAAYAPLRWWIHRPRSSGRKTVKAPSGWDVDWRLLIGAGLFGIGWGLAGLCPGPALANLAAPRVEAMVFVPTMILGMLVAQRVLGSDQPDP